MPTLVVRGAIRVPGDKSISHRSLIFAALANGASRVRNILQSEDVHATAAALRAMGVRIPDLTEDFVIVGVGPERLQSPQQAFDCGNSGTTTRLMAGMLAGLANRSARFEGDASLSGRPMMRVARPLRAMGATIQFEGADGHEGLPMRVTGAPLQSLVWDNAHASAQVKSAILLAGLTSGVGVEVMEPSRSRDHTERMLAARGVALEILPNGVRLLAEQQLRPLDTDVPADPSSAAFFAGLAALANSGALRLADVCLNPTRTGAFDVLLRMGVVLTIEDERVLGGETVGTIVVQPSQLSGTRISGHEIPTCIDELPLLACVATRAIGETRIADASELRVKESDRIAAVVANLRTLGADVQEFPDGMRIVGSDRPLRGHVFTHGDHRLAMAFGVLGAVPGNEITVDDRACVAVSYPNFWQDLERAAGMAHGERLSEQAREALGNGERLLSAYALAEKAKDRSPIVIAIDGPAASGKSSTAQWVSQRIGVRHVDSGAFYRAVTYLGLESGVPVEQWTDDALLALSPRIARRLTERSVLPSIDGRDVDEELRGPAVTKAVSRVAQMRAVREWVNTHVRAAADATDVVVDGRDIGTAVFPKANLKIFLIADPWERASRRLVQRLGRKPTVSEIATEIETLVDRDAQDATQSVAARDAITIDTTALTQEEQVDRIVALANALRR